MMELKDAPGVRQIQLHVIRIYHKLVFAEESIWDITASSTQREIGLIVDVACVSVASELPVQVNPIK